MKTIEELKTFYEQTLRPDLEDLERRRLGIFRGMGIGLVVLLLGGLVLAAVLFPLIETAAIILPIFLVVFLYAGLCVVLTRSYKKDFKNRVIGRLIGFFDPGLSYFPTEKIAKEEFLHSDLFKTKPNRYKGDDLVRGTIGKTRIEFSEVCAQHVQSNGKTTTVHTIFQGLFFIADFNKHFRTRTFVLPDSAEKMFGRFGKTLQSWNLTRPDLIQLEDPEFEKEFVVYGQDQIEARYILSTSLMERIVDFKRKTGQKIFLSFVDDCVYMGVWSNRAMFEPKILSTLLDFERIREYFDDLQLATGIVEDLNLNTRIWSKE